MIHNDVVNQGYWMMANWNPWITLEHEEYEDMAWWCSYPLWSLQQAIILLLGLETIDGLQMSQQKIINVNKMPVEYYEIYRRLRIDVLANHVESTHDGKDFFVRPVEFVKWAEGLLDRAPYLPARCKFNNQRLNICRANLDLMKEGLAAPSTHEPNGEIKSQSQGNEEPYGFTWDGSDQDLELLFGSLIRYKLIDKIDYGMFREAFNYGVSSAKIVWLCNLETLHYLINQLRKINLITARDKWKQTCLMFVQLRNGRHEEIKRETLYSSNPKSTKQKNQDNLRYIDVIVRDLQNCVNSSRRSNNISRTCIKTP